MTVNAEAYDVGLACINGHAVNGSSAHFPQFNSNFCEKCGAEAINSCPACGASIRGSYWGGAISFHQWMPSAYCSDCGKPYPWTETALSTAGAIADEDDALTPEEKALFRASLPDLASDTPKTPLAASRIRRILGKAGTGVSSAVRDVMVDVASEAAKKAIWQ